MLHKQRQPHQQQRKITALLHQTHEQPQGWSWVLQDLQQHLQQLVPTPQLWLSWPHVQPVGNYLGRFTAAYATWHGSPVNKMQGP